MNSYIVHTEYLLYRRRRLRPVSQQWERVTMNIHNRNLYVRKVEAKVSVHLNNTNTCTRTRTRTHLSSQQTLFRSFGLGLSTGSFYDWSIDSSSRRQFSRWIQADRYIDVVFVCAKQVCNAWHGGVCCMHLPMCYTKLTQSQLNIFYSIKVNSVHLWPHNPNLPLPSTRSSATFCLCTFSNVCAVCRISPLHKLDLLPNS